jgi:hypothetical protein
MTRQQLRPAFGDLRELGRLESFGDPRVKRPFLLPYEHSVGRVLHQRVFEPVARIGWRTLSEQQASQDETVERQSQLRLRLAHSRRQHGMREFPPNNRANLHGFFG